MANLKNKLEWENKICYNNNGDEFTIIEYRCTNEVIIRFTATNNIKTVTLGNIKKGSISDEMSPSVYGIGCFGVGKYKSKDNSISNINYKRWQSMLQRCYDKKCTPYKSYGEAGITVCADWLNFQNFSEWWFNNWNDSMNETWEIDKDIVNKDSKEYSPENCILIPGDINIVLTKRMSKRGNYPIGVSKKGNSYISQINKNNQKIHLGSFKSPEEAFMVYKIAKETHLKELAEEYKDIISDKAYKALLNYEVSIND